MTTQVKQSKRQPGLQGSQPGARRIRVYLEIVGFDPTVMQPAEQCLVPVSRYTITHGHSVPEPSGHWAPASANPPPWAAWVDTA